MFMIIFKIWYMIAVLPFLIFIEGSNMFGKLLKKRNIYSHWNVYHAILAVLIILYIVLWMQGYR